MPHNLYLHSALVKSRKIDHRKSAETTDANRYVLIESSIALALSFVINLFVLAVFANGLTIVDHRNSIVTNRQIYELCRENDRTDASYIDLSVMPNNTEPFNAELYSAGMYIGCRFGAWPFYVWAIGLLAAGQSSTMTGTYSGQFVMEGFLNLTWPRWRRVLLTRAIAILPTLAVTLAGNNNNGATAVQQLTGMNDYLNALMVIQLPFAILPTLTFSSSSLVMGKKFVNNRFNLISASLTSVSVILLNIYFVIQLLANLKFGNDSGTIFIQFLFYTGATIYGSLYLIFILYLVCIILSHDYHNHFNVTKMLIF